MTDIYKHVDAALYAIHKLGMNEFKKCSFFISNLRKEGWGRLHGCEPCPWREDNGEDE